jgi:hypothetical protein
MTLSSLIHGLSDEETGMENPSSIPSMVSTAGEVKKSETLKTL